MAVSSDGGRRRVSWLRPALPAIGLAGPLAILGAYTVQAWRYFPSLIGDNGWYLQVAWRVSQGDVLYRDVAWAYGPLPAQALAALFRRLGPDAGLATLLSAALTALVVLLTYAALCHLVRPGTALALTAFATLAGPYVGGDLIRAHLYAYTQAIAWGVALSLATLVAALRWLRTAGRGWLALSGVAAALACLCKPEFAVLAMGCAAATLLAGRARAGAWAGWIAVWGGVLIAAAAWQASAAGWQLLLRGYSGYDQLAGGGLWGFPGAQASPRWLLSVGGVWVGVLALLAGRRWPRGRGLAYGGAGLAGAVAVAVATPDLIGLSAQQALAALQTGAWREARVAPEVALQWLAAMPWSALSFVLLWAGWRAARCRGGVTPPLQRRSVPAAWWVLWVFALLANLRFTFTGYAAGIASAPALAVLGWLWRSRAGAARTRGQAAAPFVLAGLALVNLVAQPLSRGLPASLPLTLVRTSVGPVMLDVVQAEQLAAVQELVAGLAPTEAPIFGTDWAAGWYLVTGRPNVTPLDVILTGLGTTAPEAATVQAALASQPPAAVILPDWQWRPEQATPQRQRKAQAIRAGLPAWWAALLRDYVERTPPGVSDWVVLVRR